MFCTNCGKKLDDDMKFCIFCGAPQENDASGIEKSPFYDVNYKPPIEIKETAKVENGFLVLQDMNNDEILYATDFSMPAIMGRDKISCTMLIENDKSVSRKHCQFFCKDGRCYVKDLGSSNGTILNGEKISEVKQIKVGDHLKIGGKELVVVNFKIE